MLHSIKAVLLEAKAECTKVSTLQLPIKKLDMDMKPFLEQYLALWPARNIAHKIEYFTI